MEERWIKHYSSHHDILLVGEGDFSFSLCLARAFGSARNIVATSLDTYDQLIKKYKKAKSNLAALRKMGAFLLHGIDATQMWFTPYLGWRRFHRIIFNFPHAGFYGSEDDPLVVKLHQHLVQGFLSNASRMLWIGGEIHVSHKNTAPYTSWDIQKLASDYSLCLVACVDFKIGDYPGYHNKRGAGGDCDQPFRLGKCKTFKFQETPIHVQLPVFDGQSHFMNPYAAFNNHQEPVRFPFVCYTTDECCRIFGGYLNHVEETFGDASDDDVRNSVSKALRLGFETYKGGDPAKCSSGYIDILEELRRLSTSRLEWLKQRLSLLYLEQF